MRVVLDASAAIEVALRGKRAAEFDAILKEADVVIAPELFVAEVVNTVWKYHRFEGLSLPDCDRALEAALGLVDSLASGMDAYGEAFLLARTCQKAAYDMFYLALARREDALFLTADAALNREAQRQGIRVA